MKPFLCEGKLLDKSLKPVVMIADCTECIITEELNGIYECSLKIPVGSVFLTEIKQSLEAQKDIFIYTKANPDTEMQFFRLYKVSDSLSGEAEIYGEHIRYVLNRFPCPMIYGRNAKAFLNAVKNNVAYYSAFPFWLDSDIEGEKDFSILSVRTIGEMENQIAEYFNAEWQFSNYTAMLWKKRGNDKNIVLQYAYDISDVKNDIDFSTSYTHVFPYYSWSAEDGTIYTVTLSHKSLESQQPAILARDLIQIDFSISNDDTPRIYPVNLAEHTNIDITVGFWNGLNIRSMAEYWIEDNKASLLGIEICRTITTEELQNNIALQKCCLGDTVRIRVPKMSLEVKTRIVSYKYNSIAECYIDLGVGKIQQKLSGTIANLNSELKKTNATVSVIQSQTASAITATYNKLTNVIQSNYDDLLKRINNAGGSQATSVVYAVDSTTQASEAVTVEEVEL